MKNQRITAGDEPNKASRLLSRLQRAPKTSKHSSRSPAILRNGPSRVLLLGVLERFATPACRAALMELGTDPQVSPEVQVILRRLARRKRRR